MTDAQHHIQSNLDKLDSIVRKLEALNPAFEDVTAPDKPPHAIVNYTTAISFAEETLELKKCLELARKHVAANTGDTGHAAHVERENELQSEATRLESKVELGTITPTEANNLHSLELRTHGTTAKGGVTAHAQSAAAKKERCASLSAPTASLVTALAGRETKTAQEQSHTDKEAKFAHAAATLLPKMENAPEKVTKEEASLLHSRDARAHGHVEKGSLAAQAMSLADRNEVAEAA